MIKHVIKAIVIGALLTGCSGKIEEQALPSSTKVKADEPKEKTLTLDVTGSFTNVKVSLSQMIVKENELLLKISLINETKSTPASWDLEESNIVIENKQLNVNLERSDSMEGRIEPTVSKEGTLVFDIPKGVTLDMFEDSSIKINLGIMKGEGMFNSSQKNKVVFNIE